MNLRFTKTDRAASTPYYATAGAACFDLATIDAAEIPPTYSAALRTGLQVEVPDGHVMLLFSRSGNGFKHGIRLSNCVGVIDSDFRGEVAVKLHNDGDRAFCVQPGERVAQGMLIPVERVAFVEVESLSGTERGAGGFGSTDKPKEPA